MTTTSFSINKIFVIFKKELRFFFFSPIAYIFSALFLVSSGIYFFSRFFIIANNSMQDYFLSLPLMLSFTIPPITMSLFSAEFQSGSYELISTQSVSTFDIIIGKFLAAWAFILFAIAPTIVYAMTLSFIGRLDLGPVIAGYIGTLFLVMQMCAIGVFASSISKNQIVALIVGLSIMILFNYFLKFIAVIFPNLINIIQFASSDTHFLNIALGIIDFRDIIYFLSLSVIFLYGTYLVIENRK